MIYSLHLCLSPFSLPFSKALSELSQSIEDVGILDDAQAVEELYLETEIPELSPNSIAIMEGAISTSILFKNRITTLSKTLLNAVHTTHTLTKRQMEELQEQLQEVYRSFSLPPFAYHSFAHKNPKRNKLQQTKKNGRRHPPKLKAQLFSSR